MRDLLDLAEILAKAFASGEGESHPCKSFTAVKPFLPSSAGPALVAYALFVTSVVFCAATISNDLVFTTLYDGTVMAVSRETGNVVWEEQLPGGTNSPLVVERGMLIAINSVATGSKKPQIVAYRLGSWTYLLARALDAVSVESGR